MLVDGLPLQGFPYPHVAIVNGDARSLCVAMGSIIAKVARDRMMAELDATYPGYGFATHKGYGTDEHREAVIRLGRCAIHREMFLRKLLSGPARPEPDGFPSRPLTAGAAAAINGPDGRQETHPDRPPDGPAGDA